MSERDRGRWARPDPPGWAASDGTPSDVYCSGCGHGASAADRFCAACGRELRLPDSAAASATVSVQTEAMQRAHHQLVTGHVADAIPTLERLRDERPDMPVLLAYLGIAYLRVARVTEAQVAIEESLRLTPDDFTCRMAYGEYFARLGFYDRAVFQLDQALGLTPPGDEAYRAAFELRRYCHEKTKGLVYRRTALPSMPRVITRWSRRGRATTPAPAAARSNAG